MDCITVGTGHALSLQQHHQNHPDKTIGQTRLRNPGKNSVSSIIGSYKSVVSRHANRLQLPFAWQMRFHDHVIRDGREYEYIKNYILNNPANWNSDRFYI